MSNTITIITFILSTRATLSSLPTITCNFYYYLFPTYFKILHRINNILNSFFLIWNDFYESITFFNFNIKNFTMFDEWSSQRFFIRFIRKLSNPKLNFVLHKYYKIELKRFYFRGLGFGVWGLGFGHCMRM